MPLMILGYLLVFFFGASIFSFVNVVVYRLPRKLNYVSGRSMCPQCGKALKPQQNIPIFSFLFLRGKCAFCKAPIPLRYLLFELLGGALSIGTFLYYCNFSSFEYRSLLAYLLVFALCSVLTAVFFIDKDTMEIPNGLSISIAILGILSIFLFPEVSLLDRGIGVLCVSVPFFLLTLAIDGAFGGGDMKLMAAAGLFLGWKLTLVALFISLITGGGYGAYLLLTKKKGRKDHFAFGPFLCTGIMLSWFFGTSILNWYLGFFTQI
ncbi:MAG: prepilin peptidase [Oscillospiraceae bacterium]